MAANASTRRLAISLNTAATRRWFESGQGTMLDSASCKTNGLGAELSNLVAGFDTGCSGYLLHCTSRHASLIDCLGIPLNLAQTPVPTDGRNEVGATSRFCKAAARRLP